MQVMLNKEQIELLEQKIEVLLYGNENQKGLFHELNEGTFDKEKNEKLFSCFEEVETVLHPLIQPVYYEFIDFILSFYNTYLEYPFDKHKFGYMNDFIDDYDNEINGCKKESLDELENLNEYVYFAERLYKEIYGGMEYDTRDYDYSYDRGLKSRVVDQHDFQIYQLSDVFSYYKYTQSYLPDYIQNVFASTIKYIHALFSEKLHDNIDSKNWINVYSEYINDKNKSLDKIAKIYNNLLSSNGEEQRYQSSLMSSEDYLYYKYPDMFDNE